MTSYKSKIRYSPKNYFEYLDEEKRSHIIIDSDMHSELLSKNYQIDKWYDVILYWDKSEHGNWLVLKKVENVI